MRILLVSCVFPPEPVVSARLSRDLQERLRELGHEVTVVCPRPTRTGDGAAAAAPTAAGVHHVDSYTCRESRLIGRARESWDFGRRVARWMGAAGGPCWDAVYANVWPLFGQCGVVRAAQRLGAPVVLHVQDVYPESLAIKLPPRVYRWLAPWLVALDRAIARRCAAVVLVSARMRDTYVRSRRVAARAEVVRNWVDASPFATAYDRAAVCAEYRVPTDRFTFMYLGNLAALAALDTAIRAFAAASDGTQQFVVVGEGSAKAAYETLVRHLGLTHVLFRSEPDPAKVARVQSMADVLVLPMRCGGSLTSTPSKCISYLLSGKPIVAALDAESDVGDDLRHARCAWFCPPEDVAQLVGVLRKAAQCPPETRTAMGASGRAYALREFSRDTGLRRLVSIVEGVVRP